MKAMRFKKLASVFVAALSLFILSLTAFAADGVADTYQTAKQTIPGGITHYEWINDPTDTEWYVYHNTSGTYQTVVAYVFPGILNQILTLSGRFILTAFGSPHRLLETQGLEREKDFKCSIFLQERISTFKSKGIQAPTLTL